MKRALLSAVAAFGLATSASADTLVDNVQGVSIDRDGKVTRFTGIWIDDDGRVKALLERKDKRPQRTDFAVDGKGAYVIPGLVDSHLHVMGIGFGALTLDLSGTRTLAEAQAAIRDYAARNPDRRWIIGRGWNQETWGLGRFPTAAELDAVVADRPVLMERVDGHAHWANTQALAAAGITAATADPAGGRIERVGGSRAPSGVLVDNAMKLLDSAVPAPRPDDYDLALAKAQEILLANGVTAAADMGTTIEGWQSMRRAGDSGWLRMRIMAYAAGPDAMELIGGPGPSPWLYDDKLRLNGVKLYMDGALGSRGAWLKAPYADDPRNTGLPIVTGTQLRNVMSRAALDKFQVAVHAIGDRGNAEVLDVIEELGETYKGDRRWRIEHAQIVDPVDIARFGKTGTIASMQPVHQTSDRLMAEARLGPNRLSGAYAWRSIAAGGALLAFGTDAPVESSEPFAGLAAAISRTGPDGQPFGGWMPGETVSREAALAGYTVAGAYAGFGESRFGEIKPGLRADFLVIDRDPLLVSPEDMRKTQVLQTWVGGERVYMSGTQVDRPAGGR
ncbi:N-substituted formamide deformylase precursor [Tsuneonella dongtanensis]|uniref:N-substituted formamide deformylase n=1 Tax=Tsuneonella dongtanensis TaxID=692370 RepID=A0A1B2ACV0_9SPHN|nr:amidohydrolase [Tsuneonella dongtanensis]ANY19979.1 N-substituted formamide deformylase precursor [Tsuneonella dongtanensis]